MASNFLTIFSKNLQVFFKKFYGLQWRTIWTPMITSNNAPFWSPEAMCNPKSVPWQCTLNERLKKVHHVGVYWMKVQGLHWRSIWPLMNTPNNIPFWGPQGTSLMILKWKLSTNAFYIWKYQFFLKTEAIRGHHSSQMAMLNW